jgi:hypothetical protein
VRWTAFALTAAGLVSLTARAGAQDPVSPPPSSPASSDARLAPDAQLQIATTPPEGKTSEEAVESPGMQAEIAGEAPPSRPRKKGLVLESTMGMLAFAGQFRHVAPPAFWMHMQLGYEFFNWLMLFGEGELGYTDSSVSQDESHSISFPIWGFGGGLRATMHATERVAFFVQGDVGALTAYVPHNALAVLGFRDAESLNAQFGGRVGAEWYQVDRHFALSLEAGLRDAPGFAKVFANDTSLMWDASGGLRYTF